MQSLHKREGFIETFKQIHKTFCFISAEVGHMRFFMFHFQNYEENHIIDEKI